ncbi:3-oxoacyl-ACP synthase III family protein [Salaquimonas pukyongi]|uniref:3-oxoacyl-ACP synthase III family protein n=1 Tax=Salaquimonas pukyongi TaxID=2712698 RepID=UPI00096BC889|nr:3-oxoacyl-[acyl-carrier-protein] synthase III C-terminal domain-containing protein [Salaquimonas pukyongi]
MLKIQITGTGFHAPEKIETAGELAPRLGVSEEWASGVGVAQRRIAEQTMPQMAAIAAREALGNGPPPDLLINASLTPVQLIPDSSVFILDELGYDDIPGYSIHATCLSFLVALNNAASLIHSGAYKRILIVSSEIGSVSRDFGQPESAMLIGDGAAAAVVEPAMEGSDSAWLGFAMQTWPEGAFFTEIRGAGTRRHPNGPLACRSDNLFQMEGAKVFRLSLQKIPPMFSEFLNRQGIGVDDIDLFIPHQASGHGMKTYERLGFPAAKIVNIINEYGNCIAASLPMALDRALKAQRIKRGDLVMFFGMGAGMSTATALMRW